MKLFPTILFLYELPRLTPILLFAILFLPLILFLFEEDLSNIPHCPLSDIELPLILVFSELSNSIAFFKLYSIKLSVISVLYDQWR